MPWSFPTGGGESSKFGSNGRPLLANRRLITDLGPIAGLTPDNFDYTWIVYSPLEDRMIISPAGTASLIGHLIGLESAGENPITFTNDIPTASATFNTVAAIDYARGAGALVFESAIIYHLDSLDPAVGTFTENVTFPGLCAYAFSLASGETIGVQTNHDIHVSTDNGATWPVTFGMPIEGNNDLIHGSYNIYVSLDQVTFAIWSAAGVAFFRNTIIGGLGSAIGGFPTTGIVGPGDFNATGDIFVYTNLGNSGTVWVTTDFNTTAPIDPQNNPFNMVSGTGIEIAAVIYSPEAEGWFFMSGSTTAVCGFMSESDLTRIIPGVWVDFRDGSYSFATGVNGRKMAVDGNGNIIAVGSDSGCTSMLLL